MSQPSTSRSRFGLRRQLTLAFGLFSLALFLLLFNNGYNLARLRSRVQTTVQDQIQLSYATNDVAESALECRRYEKDAFLTVGNPTERVDYISKWETSAKSLDAAIAAYSQQATNDADKQQAALWQTQSGDYQTAMRAIFQSMQQGQITTSDAANAALEPKKETIRDLTDKALALTDEKSAGVQQIDDLINQEFNGTIVRLASVAFPLLLLSIAGAFLFPRRLLRPINDLRTVAQRLAGGDYAARASTTQQDETGVLAETINQLADAVEQRTSELQAQATAAEHARGEAEAARSNVAEQLATIESQRVMLREMSVPILPLSNETLVMPLVGALDTQRLRQIQEQGLHALEGTSVRHLLLDITGVPVVDTQVAQALIQLVQAASLLGTQVVLVGIRPEVAQAIVGLGLQLGTIATHSTLEEGLRYVEQAQHGPQKKANGATNSRS